MAPATNRPEWSIVGGDLFSRETGLATSGPVDHIIVDPPYSHRTHGGHDRGSAPNGRAELLFEAWTEAEVLAACEAFSLASGWICVLTDHILAPIWERGLRALDRYVFAPVPCVVWGSRVRLCGDGPSSWTVWLVPARTKTRAMARWGTLPGAYVVRQRRRPVIPGGKPIELMRDLVRDYSRPGDLVCDPCAGAGTTGVACIEQGRRFVGWELEHRTLDLAVTRMSVATALADRAVVSSDP